MTCFITFCLFFFFIELLERVLYINEISLLWCKLQIFFQFVIVSDEGFLKYIF